MKILFKTISAFLYFTFVSPVEMYYIYDENPNIGLAPVDSGTFMKTGFSLGKPGKKQQFTGSYSNPKYQKVNNEHVVDSHFKVMKSPSNYNIQAALDTGRLITHEVEKSKVQRIVEEYSMTDAPKQWQQKPQHQQMINTANNGQKDFRQITQIPNNTPIRGDYGSKPKEATLRAQPSNNQQMPPIRPKAVNADYRILMKQRNQDAESGKINQYAGRSQRTLDIGRSQRHKDAGRSQTQGKTQMPTDTQQKVLLNNNRQSTSLSITPQDKRQRVPTSMVIDKTLHKANGIAHDHNMQVMSRVLDAMTQKIADRRHKKGEYLISDTEKHLDRIYEKSKRSVVADNMRKYIGKDKIGKDLHYQQKHNSALARIGSHEESLEQDETPYAVFYRMNPETLDQQEGFMLMRSLDAENGNSFTSKEKRLHTAFKADTETMTAKPKKNGGSIHHKTIRLTNFTNYRNL